MKKLQTVQTASPADAKEGARRTLYQRLHLVSLAKGLAIGLVFVLVSIPMGNWRELDRKVGEAQRVWQGLEVDGKKIPGDQQLPIGDIVEGRAAAAANLLAIMSRYQDVAKTERAALEKARNTMHNAGTPKEIAEANAALQIAISDAVNAVHSHLNTEDKELLQTVTASFNEHGRKLAIRARDYDRQMQKAIDTYNDLPTRALFSKPELFSEL